MSVLPIDDVLPKLLSALATHRRAVLEAPPGAGKTTRVPLALLEADLGPGRIVMLEPRRLAARAAAARMAASLDEPIGQRVGYRIRGERKISDATRIEVVTEGILTRMIQSDPSLDGIGTVIFDEFHERSLNADLGLALCLEIAGALRDDLSLLVMSATLDSAPVAALMAAPALRSEGRAFPVETVWRDTPLGRDTRIEEAVAETILHVAGETDGGILTFLPGEAEIRRVEARLTGRLPEHLRLRPLYGAMPFDAQRAVLRPEPDGVRKLVLATSIAETSLTIEDIRVVIDAGLARRARFHAGSGMTRLVTERASRAEIAQRAGRAGRVAPGRAYRLWTRGAEGALPTHPPAEIETADLTGLALELAVWGAAPQDLPLLTPPNPGAFDEARGLLRLLGALDRRGGITAHGRALARLPLHPRLGHMLLCSGPDAASLAALLADRDPLIGASSDLTLRLDALAGRTGSAGVQMARLDRIRREARRLAASVPRRAPALDDVPRPESAAEMAALAYPDRIGLRRSGDAPRYQLSGGTGAVLSAEDPLAGERLIVVTDTDGRPREGRIRQAIAISEDSLRVQLAAHLRIEAVCTWSPRSRRVVARRQEKLGAIALSDQPWPDAPEDAVARAMLEGVRDLGLRLSDAGRRFCARVEMARKGGADLPDMSEAALLASAEDWLLPFISGLRTAEDWRGFDALPALEARLDWAARERLDALVPARFRTPLGRAVPIDYSGDHPAISVRLQELFGLDSHPMVGGEPLRVSLLSPAGRPVQVTLDLPGFWRGSYADVRKDMRARYPKHPWPEDPRVAAPTLSAKRRRG